MTASAKIVSAPPPEPRPDPSFTAAANAILEKSSPGFAGAIVLGEPISPDRRSMIATRRNILETALVPAPRRSIGVLVDHFMTRFAHPETEGETAVMRAAWIDALERLPYFAIAKAMGRFVRGEVKPKEIGETTLKAGARPGPSQVCAVATAAAEPWRREAAVARNLLYAKVGTPEPTSADRERTAAHIAESAQRFRKGAARREAARRARDTDAAPVAEKTEAERRASHERSTLAEYEAAGVTPIRQGDIVISLALLTAQGWTIQEIGAERLLVAPVKEQA